MLNSIKLFCFLIILINTNIVRSTDSQSVQNSTSSENNSNSTGTTDGNSTYINNETESYNSTVSGDSNNNTTNSNDSNNNTTNSDGNTVTNNNATTSNNGSVIIQSSNNTANQDSNSESPYTITNLMTTQDISGLITAIIQFVETALTIYTSFSQTLAPILSQLSTIVISILDGISEVKDELKQTYNALYSQYQGLSWQLPDFVRTIVDSVFANLNWFIPLTDIVFSFIKLSCIALFNFPQAILQ